MSHYKQQSLHERQNSRKIPFQYKQVYATAVYLSVHSSLDMKHNGPSETAVIEMMKSFYDVHTSGMERLRSFCDINYFLKDDSPSPTRGYILKLYRCVPENDLSELERGIKKQVSVMGHLRRQGFVCPTPIPNIHGEHTFQALLQFDVPDISERYYVLLLSYLQGSELILFAPLSALTLTAIGSYLASLRIATRNMPGCTTRSNTAPFGDWCHETLHRLLDHINAIELVKDRELVREIIQEFTSGVQPFIPDLEKGIIHGDIHDDNLLVLTSGFSDSSGKEAKIPGKDDLSTPTSATGTITSDKVITPPDLETGFQQIEEKEITSSTKDTKKAVDEDQSQTVEVDGSSWQTEEFWKTETEPRSSIDHIAKDPKRTLGLIDFGDINDTCYIFELAISIAYFTMYSKRCDFLDVGRWIVEGYESVVELLPEEKNVLYLCVCGRYCQELVLANQQLVKEPANEYVREALKPNLPQLRTLWDLGQEHVMDIWFNRTRSHSDKPHTS